MKIEVVFTKKEKAVQAIIFLKDNDDNCIDGSVAAIFRENDTEKIFIPASPGSYSDPVYPSDGDNHVYRIEKGIYHVSVEDPSRISEVILMAKKESETATKNISIRQN